MKPKLLFVIKNADIPSEELSEITESIRQWLKGDADPLVLSLPNGGTINVKMLDGEGLHDADCIALKVRLKEGKNVKAEARTQVILKKTT